MKINLPVLPLGHSFSANKNDVELYVNNHGIAILPPHLFDSYINGNLNKLITKGKEDLTEAGLKWTDAAYPLWPFLDRTQRDDDGHPVQKYPKTRGNQLKFAKFIKERFGSGTNSIFVDHIKDALQDEVVRRCIEDGGTLSDGTNPKTIDDVLMIIGSPEMKRTFRDGYKASVYKKVLYWVKSLTNEDDIKWLSDAIDKYFT
jgi:hypothetical protein